MSIENNGIASWAWFEGALQDLCLKSHDWLTSKKEKAVSEIHYGIGSFKVLALIAGSIMNNLADDLAQSFHGIKQGDHLSAVPGQSCCINWL